MIFWPAPLNCVPPSPLLVYEPVKSSSGKQMIVRQTNSGFIVGESGMGCIELRPLGQRLAASAIAASIVRSSPSGSGFSVSSRSRA